MYVVKACPVCAEAERTIVAEYNRLIFVDSMWQNDLARFDYALCHGCGLVYATRRPERSEYDFLYENFNEFLVRGKKTEWTLTAEQAAEIDRKFLPWWEVRSTTDDDKTRRMLRVDLANALSYLPYLSLHVPLEGAKVLHIRAKGATLADMLKRLFGAAKVDLITLFPEFTYMAQKQDVQAQACLDYENFSIPFDEKYDLIIENHVFVHMLDPSATFKTFHSHLEDGGFLFVHKELDDARMYRKKRNLFAELRPFHFQQHDVPTLERMLRRYGFEVTLLGHKLDKNCYKDDDSSEIVGVARLQTREPQKCPRIGADELRVRLDMYARWRDESILSLPKERCHVLYGAELAQVWERVRSNGGLETDKKGRPAALRWFREESVKDQILEISVSPPKQSRSGVADWFSDKLRGRSVEKQA
jgi:2-polyprenyl-3-methyl-5-hydroxy-6-metoxy-1,4-benzoquinol methylase